RTPASAVDLVELVEDSIELIRRDADTGIRDLEIQLVAARGAAQPHLAALGIANGIRHEVAQQPTQELRIGTAAFAARLVNDGKALLDRLRLEIGDDPLDDVVDGAVLALCNDRAAVELADIEHRREQLGHRIERLLLA